MTEFESNNNQSSFSNLFLLFAIKNSYPYMIFDKVELSDTSF